MRMDNSRRFAALMFAFAAWLAVLGDPVVVWGQEQQLQADPPAPPAGITASDKRWDDGKQIVVRIELSLDDEPDADPKPVARYTLSKAGEYGGHYEDVTSLEPTTKDYERGYFEHTVEGLVKGEEYFFRARAVGPGGVESEPVETTEPTVPTQLWFEWFDGDRFWLAVILVAICGSVIGFIMAARKGIPLKVRKIAGLDAVDEAVGRATEMGRSALFVPGIQDMNDIQTIAGLTILSRVAQVAAEYGSRIEVPTSRALVMTTARETVESAFVAAGRPDSYQEDDIYYVTDEQFGYVAYLSGLMVREKPAACFYLGSFFAESLILAETGNAIGAIQVAGTAQPAQLPFFVAACDYTLIGEEFFAASAYLSGDPDQLGSLKGQDVGKLLVAALLIIGCGLLTYAVQTGAEFTAGGEVIGGGWVGRAAEYLKNVVLR